jgi:hypothetical protein
MLTSQESSNRGHAVLHAETVVRPCGLAQKGFNVAGLKLPQLRRTTGKLEELQESSKQLAMI